MTDITAAFFAAHPAALPLYECLEARILAEIPGTRVEVRKTQINFSNAHLFACVSFLPVVKAALRRQPISSCRSDWGIAPYRRA